MADSTPHELVGRTFRSPEGGTPMTVVAVDDRFVHVKRVDASRRQLANPAGAYIVGLVEFQDWKDLSPDADPDYGEGDPDSEEDEAFPPEDRGSGRRLSRVAGIPKENGREPFLSAATELLRESGCIVRAWRSGTTGSAYLDSDDWGIAVPEPRGPVSFGTFAHEVGHQMLHRYRRRPRWIEEVEAWEYALKQFDRFGLPGRERVEIDAAKALRYTFAKARRRSATVSAIIAETYPVWWERAQVAEAEALLRPSKSRERLALDA